MIFQNLTIRFTGYILSNHPKKCENRWNSNSLSGGAYEARSHTHALKALKFEEVEHTIRFHLTTHLTTMHILEGASSF